MKVSIKSKKGNQKKKAIVKSFKVSKIVKVFTVCLLVATFLWVPSAAMWCRTSSTHEKMPKLASCVSRSPVRVCHVMGRVCRMVYSICKQPCKNVRIGCIRAKGLDYTFERRHSISWVTHAELHWCYDIKWNQKWHRLEFPYIPPCPKTSAQSLYTQLF